MRTTLRQSHGSAGGRRESRARPTPSPSMEATRTSVPALARHWMADRYQRPVPSGVRMVRSSSATKAAAPAASKRTKPIDSPLTCGPASFLPIDRQPVACGDHLHVVVVVGCLAVDGDDDRSGGRREQAAGDFRLEQRIAVQDQGPGRELVAHHPAARQVVGDLIERVEAGPDAHLGGSHLLEGLLHHICPKTGHDHGLADAGLGQRPQLPLEHAAAGQVEQAFGQVFGHRQQPAALAGAQENGFVRICVAGHAWNSRLRGRALHRRTRGGGKVAPKPARSWGVLAGSVTGRLNPASGRSLTDRGLARRPSRLQRNCVGAQATRIYQW